MDKEWLGTLRRRIARAPKGPKGRRLYSHDLREEILTFATGWLETGRRRSELSRQLGIRDQTLASWFKRDAEKETRADEAQGLVRAVEVRDQDDAPTQRTVTLPTGARIEGLSLSDVIELVRATR